MVEPLPAPDSFDVLGGLVVYAFYLISVVPMLVLPTLRLSALVMAAMRQLVQQVQRLRPRAVAGSQQLHPLQLDGLSPALARVARETRTLALELRWYCTEFVDYSSESAPTLPRSGWRESLLGGTDGRARLTTIRAEVFSWLKAVEALPAGDREVLAGLGVDVEGVRRTLTGECAPDEVVRALAGLMWSIDARLGAANSSGYRTCGASPAPGAGVAIGAGTGARTATGAGASEDDERIRRGRWAETLSEHGRGLSRMAASYTRDPGEREDLEQDIALALWQALPLFRNESSLKTFAYRVARYCCFRHVRRRKDADPTVDPTGLADPAACIESTMLQADQRARIEQALTDLPDSLESVLTLHLTGRSYAQIAEALGISERNVSVRLSRARAHLRRQLVAA